MVKLKTASLLSPLFVTAGSAPDVTVPTAIVAESPFGILRISDRSVAKAVCTVTLITPLFRPMFRQTLIHTHAGIPACAQG